MQIDQEYLDRLLMAFASAATATTDIKELARVGFVHDDKFLLHLRQLHDLGLVAREDGQTGIGHARGLDGHEVWSVLKLRLTPFGYDRARELQISKTSKAPHRSDAMTGGYPEAPMAMPPHFGHLEQYVTRFWADHGVDRAVFVMMKFPDSSDSSMSGEHVRLLQDIYRTIDEELRRYSLVAVRADDKAYHHDLFDNVCVYMLGSPFGIAVLEDKVRAELNPNISLEYGFMRALGRDVALFREQGFAHNRADLLGKIAYQFTVGPDGLEVNSVRQAVEAYMIRLHRAAVRPRP